MEIRELEISALKPAPYNPRVMLKPGMPGYDKLAASLLEYDLVQPIVWNCQTGHIVSGHQRAEILKHLGKERVPVVVVSLDLEQEKGLNITLNNAHVGSTWDTDKLVDLIDGLHQLVDVEMPFTGFDEEELHDLLLTPNWDYAVSESDNNAADNISVSLDIPCEQWDAVEQELNELMREYAIRVHVHSAVAAPKRK